VAVLKIFQEPFLCVVSEIFQRVPFCLDIKKKWEGGRVCEGVVENRPPLPPFSPFDDW
jgi:hypothetical protein